MNVPLLPETLALRGDDRQAELPLATEGVMRYVWNNRWGSMLIEVREGRMFVDGKVVEPVSAAAAQHAA